MKHKADGLYYVNEKMLRKAGACSRARDEFTRVFGKGDVPLTLENAKLAQENDISLNWAVSRIRNKGQSLGQEWVSMVDYMSFDDWNSHAPRQFMNLIAKRARKEGKL